MTRRDLVPNSLSRRGFLAGLLALPAAAAQVSARQAERRRQPPARDYIKVLEDPHRIERLKPDEVIRTLGLKSGDVVADIGSGSGLFARPIARLVAPAGKVYAVDIDRELLEHVARTALEQGIENVTTVLGNPDGPALTPASIDLAFICDTLHHIEARAAYLASVRAALRPGGRVAIIDFSTAWPSGHESMRFSIEDLEKWTVAAGFTRTAEYSTVPGNFFHVYAAK